MKNDSKDSSDPSGSSCDADFRVLGRIREEDLEVQDVIREFVKGFEEVNKKSTEVGASQGIEEEESQDLAAEGVKLREKAGDAEKELKLGPTLLERLLRFFVDLQDKLIGKEIGASKERYLILKERRKKRVLVEAMISMLKRLSLNGKALTFEELINEHIRDLITALEVERDPQLRRIMQDRLTVLMQLRVQLSRNLIVGEKVMFFLMQCAIASAYVHSPAIGNMQAFQGLSKSFTCGMTSVMDMEGIGRSMGRGEEIGSTRLSIVLDQGGIFRNTLVSNMLLANAVGVLRSMSSLDGMGLSGTEKVLYVDQHTRGMNDGVILENAFLNGIVRATNGVIGAITNKIMEIAVAVARGIGGDVGRNNPGYRGVSPNVRDSNVFPASGRNAYVDPGRRNPHEQQQGARYGHGYSPPRQNRTTNSTPDRDTHHADPTDTNIRFEFSRERVERSAHIYSYIAEGGAYLVRGVVCTFKRVAEKISFTISGNADRPSSKLESVSIETLEQNQVLIATQGRSR